ncbi:hypothetical protein [Paraclostridium bifermentans]|uniref:hypothetical protein n=1 Tax=Paraclostridium bifermentans TaxID=1490 RepID=UPI0025AFEB65|nr:hypothetical protein [Paraclostridium bifermentans]
MLNIPGQNQTGILSTPVKIALDNERLIEDMRNHMIKELEEFSKNIDFNNYIKVQYESDMEKVAEIVSKEMQREITRRGKR